MQKGEVARSFHLQVVSGVSGLEHASTHMRYAVITMQRPLIQSASTPPQAMWRLLSERGGQVHRGQEKALRVGARPHLVGKLNELAMVIAPMVCIGLLGLSFTGLLSLRCLVNALTYAAIGISIVAMAAFSFATQSRHLGACLRGRWRQAWRLDQMVTSGFAKPVEAEMSARASASAQKRAQAADRESQELVRRFRERAGLIAEALSPRLSPVPVLARGA